MTVPREISFPDGAAVLDLDVAWTHGSEAAKYNTDPDIQVHACDEHTWILRQNMAVSYEAPFMFLLFGASRAALLDTGATENPEFFLDCLATPGHHQAAVTYYDRYSGILFTGDTVYPGRLYVFDWMAFVRSIDRLADWCAQRPVTYLIGCHIEMTTTPGVDYPAGWSYQPDEPPLQLTADHLAQIQDTLKSHDLKPDRYVLPQIIITPVS